MPKKDEYVRFKNYERKINPTFINYADFGSILVPEDNGKQNPEESYTNKNQNHIACNYDYKLTCFDDKFIKPFKTYSGEDAVYNFVNSMIEESKYCSEAIKKNYKKKINEDLVMTKKDNEDFKNSTKCWICDNNYIDNDAKMRSLTHYWKM